MTSRPETHYLRLFPLQAVVLFPQMELPLVVFEPRYLQLVQECTDDDEPFGIVLLKAGREVGDNDADPFKIGTTAHITNVSDAGGGRLSLTAVGGERFRAVDFIRNQSYLAAEVEYLDDSTGEDAQPWLIDNVREETAALVRSMTALRGGYVSKVDLPDDATKLSFHIAQMFQGNAPVQQRLLETKTFDRLWEELDLIRKAAEGISRRFKREGPGSSFSSS
jgi:Lon protease-like protein